MLLKTVCYFQYNSEEQVVKSFAACTSNNRTRSTLNVSGKRAGCSGAPSLYVPIYCLSLNFGFHVTKEISLEYAQEITPNIHSKMVNGCH